MHALPRHLALLLTCAGLSAALHADEPATAGSAPAAPAAEAVTLDPFEVTDSKPAAPVEPTTLKLPTTLHETPRSVSVIDAERIREQNFRTPVDTFYYTPGVFPNSTASGGYHYIARGFRMSPNETRLDGFTGYYVGGGQSAQSLYGVDRVVVLRGPAGLLYGAAALPGGLVNIITKKPQDTASTRIDVTTSTYGGNGVDFGDRATFGAELDTTGPLTDDGRVLYRAIIAGDDAGQYTDDVLNQTRYYSGALTFKIDPEGRNTFTPVVQYADYDRPAGSAMVISPSTSLSTNDGSTGPVNTADLSPLDVNLYGGGRTDTMFATGFDFKSLPSEATTLNAGYRYIAYDTAINQWTPAPATLTQTNLADPRSWTISRTQAKSEAERNSHNFDLNGTYEFEPAAWWKNLVQAGFNARLLDSTSRSATYSSNAPQSPINIYTGQTTSPLLDRSNGWAAPAYADDYYWNAYLQNQAAFLDERWVLTLGLGYGEEQYGTLPAGARRREGDVTPNAALVYNWTKSLALYASYSTSYQPADATFEDINGDTGSFDPQTGVNHEIGAKYDLPGRRASVAVALFETRRDNVLVQSGPTDLNPNGNRYYTQEEGQSAQGVEFSSTVRILENWRVDGTFAWIDASYENGTAFSEPVAKTPEYSWSLFTRYDFIDGPLKNLGASLGLVWQDDRMGGNGARTAAAPDPLILPDFYRVDAGLFYRIGRHWDLALNIQNLLDETIFVDGTTGANLQVAAPRTYTLRVGYQF